MVLITREKRNIANRPADSSRRLSATPVFGRGLTLKSSVVQYHSFRFGTLR